MDLSEGTYKLLNNSAGFVVAAFSTILFAPVPNEVLDPPTTPGSIVIDGENKTKGAPNGGLDVKDGGKAVIEAANRPADNTDPALLDFTGTVARLDNAGTVILRDGAWVRFNHTEVDTWGGFVQSNPESNPLAPKELLQIEAGCKITCRWRSVVSIDNGSMEMTEKKSGTGEVLADQPDVMIDGSTGAGMQYALSIGKLAKLKAGQGRTVQIKLDIQGVLWWTGDIELFADHTAFKNDKVQVSDRVLVDNQPDVFGGQGDPKLRVAWFNAAVGEPVAGQGPWTLMVSNFTNPPGGTDDPIDHEPKYEPPPAIGNRTPTIARNEQKTKIEKTW